MPTTYLTLTTYPTPSSLSICELPLAMTPSAPSLNLQVHESFLFRMVPHNGYLFCNLSSLIVDIPLLPEERISSGITIRHQGKLNPVGNNLMIIKEFGLINFNVTLVIPKLSSPLGAKPVSPVIQVISNLHVTLAWYKILNECMTHERTPWVDWGILDGVLCRPVNLVNESLDLFL